MRKIPSQLFPVSIIVPMRNSQTTVVKTLQSILKQKYPITEIIVIDNASLDHSVERVEKFSHTVKRIPIKLIRQKVNLGVGTSYNLGVAKSKSAHVIFMHSDSILIDKDQFTLLTEPFRRDPRVIATCALTTLPWDIWLRYPFWEKCLLIQTVGKYVVGLNAKCDCHKKETFLKIGGFDEKNYARGGDIGGEDGDLALRLRTAGKIVPSEAKVVHLHSLNENYSLVDLIKNRKLLARTYGRFLRFHPNDYRVGTLVLIAKPVASILSVIGPYPWNILLLIIFANAFYIKMFTTPAAWKHKEILLLPFVAVFLVFYETFWNIEGFLYLKRKHV